MRDSWNPKSFEAPDTLFEKIDDTNEGKSSTAVDNILRLNLTNIVNITLMADTKALFEKYNRQYKQKTKSDQPAFDFKLQKSGPTEVVFRGSKPPLIRVNVNKMTPGTVPHEVFHTMMKQQFKNDVGLSTSLANNISKTLNGVDWTFGLKNVKGGLKGVVEKAYEKIQDKSTFSEEYNAAVIDLLRSPENYEKLITGNVFGQIVQDLSLIHI